MSLTLQSTSAVALLQQFQAPAEPRAEDLELPALPGLDSVLGALQPLPPQGVLIGVASEGLPAMLNLQDPAPGPILVLGDAGAGKTDLLRFVAGAITRTHRPHQVQFCAVTPHPDEWYGFQGTSHCRGIVDSAGGAASYALGELADSVREDPGDGAVLLLVDDPTALDTPALDLLHWLLANGPAARLWPLVTLNTRLALRLPDCPAGFGPAGLRTGGTKPPGWVAPFRTRIFGRIAQRELADEYTPARDAALHNLRAGSQFCMRSERHWVRFRIPLSPDGGLIGPQ